MNKFMEEAIAIRASITGLADGASDEKLIDNKAAFPHWNGNGVAYTAGIRYSMTINCIAFCKAIHHNPTGRLRRQLVCSLKC